MFNQFVVRAEEPLLFHTGLRALFPLVSDAVARIVPLDQLRWITFGHVEADECGAMNQFLAAAPNATVAHGAIACMVQVNDLADRAPHPLAADEVLDLGGRRVRNIDTPHIPHGWDAHVLYEETTRTLFCGDLFTTFRRERADDDRRHRRGRARGRSSSAPRPRSHRRPRRRSGALAELDVDTLALMHGPAYQGDCTKSLLELADGYAACSTQRRSSAPPSDPVIRRTACRQAPRPRHRQPPHRRHRRTRSTSSSPTSPARPSSARRSCGAPGSTARPGPPSAHASRRSTRSPKRPSWTNKPVVTVVDPDRTFAFARTEKFGGTVDWVYRFEPDGEGTLVTESYEVTRTLSPIGWFIIGVLFNRKDRRTDLRTGMEQTLRRIQAVAEHAKRDSPVE